MRHTMLRSILTISLLGTTAGSAFAGPPWVAGRQPERIAGGVARGALTPGEARSLELEQERIARERELFLSDGSISSAEAVRLKAARRRAGRHIADLSHNGLRARQ